MDDRAVGRQAGLDRHGEGRVDHGGGRSPIEGPPHDQAAPCVEHATAVDLAVSCRMLGDVGHPLLVGPVPLEVPVHEVVEGRLTCLVGFVPAASGKSPDSLLTMMERISFLFTT